MSQEELTLVFRGGCDLTTQIPTILTLSDCIPCRYDAGICRHQREHTGVIEIMRVEQLGNVTKRDRKNPSQGRVYNDNALAPTINTCGGGGLQPMIIQTVAMQGRGERGHTEQNLEIRGDIANALTSVEKDNLAMIIVKEATKDGFTLCELGGGGKLGLYGKQNKARASDRQRQDKSNNPSGEYP